MRTQVVKELIKQLRYDTDEFQRWIDDRYKWTSPIGQRLSDYAGGVDALVKWLEDEVSQTTV